MEYKEKDFNETVTVVGKPSSISDDDCSDHPIVQNTDMYAYCDHPDCGEQVECDDPDAEIVNLTCTNDCDSYLSRVYYYDREEEPDDMYNTGNEVVEGSDTASGERKGPPGYRCNRSNRSYPE